MKVLHVGMDWTGVDRIRFYRSSSRGFVQYTGEREGLVFLVWFCFAWIMSHSSPLFLSYSPEGCYVL